MQIVNLLNVDTQPEIGSHLCLKVLQALTALLSGNEASRNRVRDDIGYDTLYSVIARLVGSEGMSRQLLMQLLSLILEVRKALKHLSRSMLLFAFLG